MCRSLFRRSTSIAVWKTVPMCSPMEFTQHCGVPERPQMRSEPVELLHVTRVCVDTQRNVDGMAKWSR